MSSIRIKVQLDINKPSNNSYGKTKSISLKFVYCLELGYSKTIEEFRHELEKYIIEKFSYKNIQIVQLTTFDGYILSNNDQCSRVLQDDDRIIAIDMEKFVEENYSTLDLENLWCEIKQYDASDSLEKYIQVGLDHLGKLFIRMRGTSTKYGLYIFSFWDLIEIRERFEKDNIIARLADENWFMEVKWSKNSITDKCLYLICNLKIGSSQHIWSKQLQILFRDSSVCIEKGDLINLSNEINENDTLNDQQRARLEELARQISSPKRTGPEIDVDRNKNKRITNYECEGESSVRMTYGSTNTVTTYQDLRKSENGTFRQHFIITHITFSKKLKETLDELDQQHLKSIDKSISIINLTVFYQNNDELWYECNDVAIAPIVLRNEEPKWLADPVINIESDKIVSMAIKGYLYVNGDPGRDNITRQRIHKSLPQPFRLKIVLTDNFSHQSSLIVEQLNKPLEYDTSESFIKYNQSSINEFLAFVYADDCQYDERIFMAIYLNKENNIVIQSGHTYSITLERRTIRTMEFNAKQNQTTELSLDSIYYQSGAQEKRAVALFDSATYMLYAIRLEISTNTSKTEEIILLPLEKIR